MLLNLYTNTANLNAVNHIIQNSQYVDIVATSITNHKVINTLIQDVKNGANVRVILSSKNAQLMRDEQIAFANTGVQVRFINSIHYAFIDTTKGLEFGLRKVAVNQQESFFIAPRRNRAMNREIKVIFNNGWNEINAILANKNGTSQVSSKSYHKVSKAYLTQAYKFMDTLNTILTTQPYKIHVKYNFKNGKHTKQNNAVNANV